MKRFKIVFVFLLVSLLLSCDTDQDDISISEAEAKELTLITQNGEWKISKFTVNETENTANYSDYVFVFEEGNNLTAFGSLDEVSGTWRVSNDSGGEFDPHNDVDFHIFFNSQGKLGELANNYDVIAATDSEIRLIREQNRDNDSAILIFSKN